MTSISKEDLSRLPDEEIEQLVSSARAELAKCEADAQQLASASTRAASAFESDPSSATLSAKEVAAQIAVNARKKAAELAAASQPILSEGKRRENARKLLALRAAMEWRADAQAAAGRVAAVYDEFQTKLVTELASIDERLVRRQRLLGEANALEQQAGSGVSHGALRFGRLIEFISEHLERRFGKITSGGSYAQLTYWDGGSSRSGICEPRMRVSAHISPEIA